MWLLLWALPQHEKNQDWLLIISQPLHCREAVLCVAASSIHHGQTQHKPYTDSQFQGKNPLFGVGTMASAAANALMGRPA